MVVDRFTICSPQFSNRIVCVCVWMPVAMWNEWSGSVNGTTLWIIISYIFVIINTNMRATYKHKLYSSSSFCISGLTSIHNQTKSGETSSYNWHDNLKQQTSDYSIRVLLLKGPLSTLSLCVYLFNYAMQQCLN